jgi:putative ribosome biogenesis GTPase RsgA
MKQLLVNNQPMGNTQQKTSTVPDEPLSKIKVILLGPSGVGKSSKK